MFNKSLVKNSSSAGICYFGGIFLFLETPTTHLMPTTRPVVEKGSSFEELYTKYRAGFVSVALRYVQNRMVAEDIVSDCFVSYWENRSGTVVENIPAYVLRSVRNRCLDWLRSQINHAQAHSTIQSVEERLMRQNIATLEANMPSTIFMAEVSEIIRRELARMPERTRKVFVAHRFRDMSYAEIARLYHLSQGQVQSDILLGNSLSKRCQFPMRQRLPEE